ncbi:hypothetical protein [Tabrizicola sp.]|uniref:hypothetical protein n=1 Tax=Tabrizicola sp. TaxID=2005166 RepID=UPI003D2B1D55
MAKSKKPEENAEMTEIVMETASDVVADVSPQADAPKTPKIVIDGVEYDATNLSDPAKGAIASLQFAEAKLMALQNELAICQTAHFAYVKGLKAELEGAAG